ncbi:putative ATPase [Microbacterium sp. SORGH_AS 344]|nr:putative ATPase [Microbacterium sp. SORGH_AS_0344]
MADSFRTIRIDGTDYRQRAIDGAARVLGADEYTSEMDAASTRGVASDDTFSGLVGHLARVHPSRFIRLIDGVTTIGLRDVQVLHDQSAALRLVAFVDRAYDAQIPIRATGSPLSSVFSDEMLAGGYRKKYLRAVSRMVALTHS